MEWDFSKIEDLRRRKSLIEGRDVEWKEIAQATSITEPTLLKYRQNRIKRPQLKVVLVLCEYFGVPLSFFVRGEAGDDLLNKVRALQNIPEGPMMPAR